MFGKMKNLFLKYIMKIKNNNQNTNENTYVESANDFSAETLLNQLKEYNSNVNEILVFTEETDLNGLLGRPGNYISKVDFSDFRLEQLGDSLSGEQ